MMMRIRLLSAHHGSGSQDGRARHRAGEARSSGQRLHRKSPGNFLKAKLRRLGAPGKVHQEIAPNPFTQG
jgi:hypothetical protein